MKKLLALLVMLPTLAFAASADQAVSNSYDSSNNALRVKVISGGGGTPGGSSGDLQYNNAGAFGGYTPGTGVVTFLQTPTSANLAAALTNETGSGATVQSCTLTFAVAYAVAPACIVNDESAILTVRAVATTTTLVLDSAVAGTLASSVLTYVCHGL